MADHNKLGIKGEERAVSFLRTKNYQILETNWRYLKAEIDIIAKVDSTLVIVEVKTRSSASVMKPEEAVNEKKMNLLIEAAEAYCEIKQLQLNIRFDIIAILDDGNKVSIKHLADINAF